MTDKFTVTKVDTFRFDHKCFDPSCKRVFTMQMTGTQAQANAARNTPLPDVNGWRGGYCPEHATP